MQTDGERNALLKIYAIKIEDVWNDCQQYSKRLQKERIEHIGLRHPNQQDQSLAGSLLLDFAVHKEFPNVLRPFRWGYHTRGKPFLVDYPEVCFSIAHSAEWVVCAVATHAVGLDIEKQRSVRNGIADRFLHSREQQHLQSLGIKDRESAFFDIWVLKESVLKAKGGSLFETLKHTEIRITNGAVQVYVDNRLDSGTAAVVPFPEKTYHLGCYSARKHETYQLILLTELE